MLFIASAKVHASFDFQTERHATVDLNQATRAPDARRGRSPPPVDQKRRGLDAVPASTIRTRVENAISSLLPHGRVDDVALSLGMSKRTLARRLSDEKLNFTEVLQQLRRNLAVRYLDDPKLHISKIAWLLGFNEVSAFTHAFKRWTGKVNASRLIACPSPAVFRSVWTLEESRQKRRNQAGDGRHLRMGARESPNCCTLLPTRTTGGCQRLPARALPRSVPSC